MAYLVTVEGWMKLGSTNRVEEYIRVSDASSEEEAVAQAKAKVRCSDPQVVSVRAL